MKKMEVTKMNISEQIKILCVKKGISMAELARLSNISPQNFNQKLKRNSFNVDDLKKIAASINCKYVTSFIMPDGDRIEY